MACRDEMSGEGHEIFKRNSNAGGQQYGAQSGQGYLKSNVVTVLGNPGLSETETELGDVIDNRERKSLWQLSLKSDVINVPHCVIDALSTVLHSVQLTEVQKRSAASLLRTRYTRVFSLWLRGRICL